MLSDLVKFFPSLAPAELLLLPNETVDAVTTAFAVRSHVDVLNAAISSGTAGQAFTRTVQARIAFLRSGVKEDEDEMVQDVLSDEQRKKYGLPVTDCSDSALGALGIKRGPDTRQE